MKRVICLSLSLIIMICSIVSVDLSAYAVSTESDDFKVVYVNPMLKDYRREILDELSDVEDEALKEEAQSAVSYSSLKFASTYPTQAQAADTLRDAMISRKKSIDIQFVSGTSSVSAIDSVFNEAVDQSNSENAVGGDYLLYHIEAASYRGTRNPVSGKWLFDVTFAVTYLTTALQEERVTYEINQINKRLDLSGKSDYIKALEIHDTVCDYIKYDYDYVFAIDQYGINPIKHSVYGGLFSSLAVCQSYATLYHRLCYENGLKSRVVTSYDHAWNIVNVYGKNYFVDCTFDDGIYDNIDDENGNYWADVYSYIYFLYGSKEVPDTKHILESKYNKSDFKNAYPIEAYGLNGNNCPHEASENDAPENASCAEGFTGDIRCRVCLFWLGNYDVPAGSNHSYINEVVAPTCTSKGYTSHICEYCQYSYTDNSTAKLGHNYKDRITYATLTSKGKVTPVCTVCKVSKSSTTTYPVKTFTLSYTSYTYNGSQK
ncbi:MAG: hypothetical protein J1E81_10385, partial [Eubacterium sp.]|nr:hypothetical protein [Eubacterium sp.]